MKTLVSFLIVGSCLADQTLVLQEGAEIRRNGYSMELVYEDLHHALLDQANPTTNFGDDGAPPLMPLLPPGGGDQTQILLHFDHIVGPGVWQIPPGAIITDAQLILPFDTTGGDIRVAELLFPWDPHTVTWDDCGPIAGDGVSFPDEGFPFLMEPLPLPPSFLDIQPIVQAWVDDPDANNGLLIELPSGPPNVLRGPNFRDLNQFNEGLPFHIPVGEMGVRSLPEQEPFFKLTEPFLLTDDPFVSPILIIDFVLPPDPLDPLGNAFFSPPQILPPGPGNPLPQPILVWEGPPGMEYKGLFSQDLTAESWLCPPGLFPFEEFPGQYWIPFPVPQNGQPAPKQFGKVVPGDNNGDGFFGNRMGRSNAQAAKEDCPENALAPFFNTVERTGRLLKAAQNDQERNALIKELRTVELIYEFAKIHYQRNYGSEFQKVIRSLMEGRKGGLPETDEVEAMEMIKHAIEYLRYLLWWEMTYNEKLNNAQKDEIQQLHDNLVKHLEELCALQDPETKEFSADDRDAFDAIICDKVIRDIRNALNSTSGANQAAGGGSIILKTLLLKLASEGANGLWERLLTHVIGKSFVDGTFKQVNRGLNSIMLIINAIRVHLQAGEIEEAKRAYNKAVCALYDEASKLDKFTLIDEGVDQFQAIHSGKIHGQMKKTIVTATAWTWVPSTDPDAEEGEGEWVDQSLTFLDGSTEKEFKAGAAEQDPDSSTRFHDFIVNMPDVEPGQKTYVVYTVTREWCLPNGKTVTQTDNYFRGVVKQREDVE
ncbi:MAG: hypothetical protein ACSHYF_05295 [Verrucomicrobiaceae bacterium]